MNELKVSLIVRSASVSLQGLTDAIGVAPGSGHDRGEVLFGGRRKHFQKPMPDSTWIVDSQAAATASIDDHVRSLMTIVPPARVRDARASVADLTVELDVAVFFSGQAAHVEFTREMLDKVNEYGATLVVTSYVSGSNS